MKVLSSSRRLTVVAAAVGFLGLVGATSFAQLPNHPTITAEEGDLPPLMARINLPNGATRTVVLQGVGCSISICSTHAIGGRAENNSLVNTGLDTIAAIKETTENDALFVLKNGTQQRLSFVHGMTGAHDGRNKQSYTRFLYLANHYGIEAKIDLADVKSVEFLGPERSVRN